jgi:hypothetical protein
VAHVDLIPFSFDFVESANEFHDALGMYGLALECTPKLSQSAPQKQVKPNPKANLGVVTIGYVAIASQNGFKTYGECLDVFMTPDVDPFEHDRLAGRVDRPEVALPAAYRFDGGLTLPGSPELLR